MQSSPPSYSLPPLLRPVFRSSFLHSTSYFALFFSPLHTHPPCKIFLARPTELTSGRHRSASPVDELLLLPLVGATCGCGEHRQADGVDAAACDCDGATTLAAEANKAHGAAGALLVAFVVVDARSVHLPALAPEHHV